MCVVFKATPAEQERLIRSPRFVPCKLGAKHGWTSLKVGPGMDWKEMAALVRASYRLLANQRMLKALDG